MALNLPQWYGHAVFASNARWLISSHMRFLCCTLNQCHDTMVSNAHPSRYESRCLIRSHSAGRCEPRAWMLRIPVRRNLRMAGHQYFDDTWHMPNVQQMPSSTAHFPERLPESLVSARKEGWTVRHLYHHILWGM